MMMNINCKSSILGQFSGIFSKCIVCLKISALQLCLQTFIKRHHIYVAYSLYIMIVNADYGGPASRAGLSSHSV